MFKKGQKVWCAIYGAGVVQRIRQESGVKYPVIVLFNNGDERTATYTNDGKYHNDGNVTLFPYPIEITKAITKPSIDWDHVHGKYSYLAADDMGNAWLYGKEPTIDDDNGYWDVELGEFALADTHVSYAPGTCDWKESLVKRPEGEAP